MGGRVRFRRNQSIRIAVKTFDDMSQYILFFVLTLCLPASWTFLLYRYRSSPVHFLCICMLSREFLSYNKTKKLFKTNFITGESFKFFFLKKENIFKRYKSLSWENFGPRKKYWNFFVCWNLSREDFHWDNKKGFQWHSSEGIFLKRILMGLVEGYCRVLKVKLWKNLAWLTSHWKHSESRHFLLVTQPRHVYIVLISPMPVTDNMCIP